MGMGYVLQEPRKKVQQYQQWDADTAQFCNTIIICLSMKSAMTWIFNLYWVNSHLVCVHVCVWKAVPRSAENCILSKSRLLFGWTSLLFPPAQQFANISALNYWNFRCILSLSVCRHSISTSQAMRMSGRALGYKGKFSNSHAQWWETNIQAETFNLHKCLWDMFWDFCAKNERL